MTDDMERYALGTQATLHESWHHVLQSDHQIVQRYIDLYACYAYLYILYATYTILLSLAQPNSTQQKTTPYSARDKEPRRVIAQAQGLDSSLASMD